MEWSRLLLRQHVVTRTSIFFLQYKTSEARYVSRNRILWNQQNQYEVYRCKHNSSIEYRCSTRQRSNLLLSLSIDVITKYGLTILCSRLMLASNPYDILTDYSGFLKNERNSKKKLIANGEPGANKKKATRKRIIRVERQEYPKDSLRRAVEQKVSSILAPSMSSADTTWCNQFRSLVREL